MHWPKENEYAPFYADYIANLKDENIIMFQKNQLEKVKRLFNSIDADKGNYAYAEGKWTIKEILGHLTDAERILAYRALSFARGEKQILPGFEQDDYVKEGYFKDRTIEDLLKEFIALRESNIEMFKSFSDEILMRRGNANNSEFTVNAFQYIIPGHVEHHLKILKKKYM